MKKIFAVSMLVALAMICSCQKQGSTAKQQLAQRASELDARETALDGREKALEERERALTEREGALAEREKAIASVLASPPELQSKSSDPAQVKADQERRLEQLPADVRALIPDAAKVLNSIKFAKKPEATQADAAQVEAERQKRIEQLPPEVQALIPDTAKVDSINIDEEMEALENRRTSGKTGSPAAESASQIPSSTPH
jgi:chromosome segregation ATPase